MFSEHNFSKNVCRNIFFGETYLSKKFFETYVSKLSEKSKKRCRANFVVAQLCKRAFAVASDATTRVRSDDRYRNRRLVLRNEKVDTSTSHNQGLSQSMAIDKVSLLKTCVQSWLIHLMYLLLRRQPKQRRLARMCLI